jgi:hypothetical protein
MKVDELAKYNINTEEILDIIERYKSNNINIIVTGEFSSGKSTFINCVINRRDYLPSGQTECTPVLIDIYEGEENKIIVTDSCGTSYDVDNNSENIFKYAKYDSDCDSNIISISIPLVNSGLPERVHLIDTPGTNTSIEHHEELTNYIIKKADAVLYLFNKTISNSDIASIKNIMQYTSDIIFVMTHSDEKDNKTGEQYTRERIDDLLKEARKEISKGLNLDIDNIVICNIGAIDGLDNRDEINEVIGLIDAYVQSQSQERRKRVARHGIEQKIKDALDEYALKIDILRKKLDLDDEEIRKKRQEYESAHDKCNKDHEDRMEYLDQQIERHEELCISKLSRMLAEEENILIQLFDVEGIDNKTIEEKVRCSNGNISKEVRKTIEDSIKTIAGETYTSINKSLEEIGEPFDISDSFCIDEPDIEEFDNSIIVSKLADVERQIDANIIELRKIKETSSEHEKVEIDKQIQPCVVQKDEVMGQLLQLGTYKPEYALTEIEGGRNAGRITGRIIGEIADMALLLWNPAGAAAGTAKGASDAAKVASKATKAVSAADKAKDVATMARYIKMAASKASKTKEEIDSKKSNALRIADTLKKADSGRRELIDRVQEYPGESQSDGIKLSDMLDLLSIGHWTEMVGGAIGEAINPTRVSYVEDLDHKNAYDNERGNLEESLHELTETINDLKKKQVAVDDFGQYQRLEKEIKEKNRALEEKKKELEKFSEIAAKKHNEEQIKTNWIGQIKQYENNQKTKGVDLIHAIFTKTKAQLVEKSTMDLCEKLSYYDEQINSLDDDSIDLSSEIIDCEKTIGELTVSISEIEKWLD